MTVIKKVITEDLTTLRAKYVEAVLLNDAIELGTALAATNYVLALEFKIATLQESLVQVSDGDGQSRPATGEKKEGEHLSGTNVEESGLHADCNLSLQYLTDLLVDIELDLREEWMQNAGEMKMRIGEDALINALIDAWHDCRIGTLAAFLNRLRERLITAE